MLGLIRDEAQNKASLIVTTMEVNIDTSASNLCHHTLGKFL
jgi:hypothetical protein